MEDQVLYLVLAGLFGLFMAWGIGANDVANAMATSIGSGALTIRQAILVAAVFEFSGAVLAGGEVTSTIRRGIIDSSYVAGDPEVLIFWNARCPSSCCCLVAGCLTEGLARLDYAFDRRCDRRLRGSGTGYPVR